MNQINGLAPAALAESLLKMKASDADPTFRFNQGSYSNGPCNSISTEILQLTLSKAARNKNIAEKRDPDYCLQRAQERSTTSSTAGTWYGVCQEKSF